jgi:CxxC-x17-CxxC domain-containing protein
MNNLNNHINFSKEKGKTNARKDDTSVTCIKCKKRFILPFRPRKPEIYCDECFKNKQKQKFKK